MTYTTGYESPADESEDLERAADYLLNDDWPAFRVAVCLEDEQYRAIRYDIEDALVRPYAGDEATFCDLGAHLRTRAQELAYEHANPSDTRRRDEEAKADAMVDRLDFGDAA